MSISISRLAANFMYQSLTNVHRYPSYTALQTALNQLSANASTVPSTKGGGQHAYAGIVLSNVQYATISKTPWVDPINPGPLPTYLG